MLRVLSDASAAGHKPAARKLSRVLQPTETERFFDKDAVIVSKTDLKGRITYVNRTFMGISGYAEAELLGQPHSLIRHPDMPRAIFKLMWDLLDQRREVFAYVKNLARDGSFYWVMAHVTPSFGPSGEVIGYHSNRRVPDRRIVDEVITPLYRGLLAVEQGEPDRRIGLERSSAQLAAVLKDKGVGYDEFFFSL